MGDLSYVGQTGHGCLIYRETSGRYVVNHHQHPQGQRPVATLASAYAACQALDMDVLQALADQPQAAASDSLPLLPRR